MFFGEEFGFDRFAGESGATDARLRDGLAGISVALSRDGLVGTSDALGAAGKMLGDGLSGLSVEMAGSMVILDGKIKDELFLVRVYLEVEL